MTVSSDFTVTNKRIIIYRPKYTLPIGIKQLFTKKLFM